MSARLSAFVIWSLVAATAVFWALRFLAQPLQAPPYTVAVGKSTPLRGDLTRLFGAPPVIAAMAESVPDAPSRFKLVGVMAPRGSHAEDASAPYGLALIAVDGKPAKAFAIGSRLEENLVLQSVSLRSASLGPATGARSVLLELPVLPPPATGVLSAAGSPASPGMPTTPVRLPPVPGSGLPVPLAPVQGVPPTPVMQVPVAIPAPPAAPVQSVNSAVERTQ